MNLESLKLVKDTDIQEVGDIYETSANNIKEEERVGYFITNEMLENEDTVIFSDLNDLIDKSLYNCCDFDERIFRDFIEGLVKESDNYLVVHLGNRGRDVNYKFTNDIMQCFNPPVGTKQYVIGATLNDKVVSVNEIDNDNPSGIEVLVIALTNEEFDILKNSSFDKVIHFALKKRGGVKYVE